MRLDGEFTKRVALRDGTEVVIRSMRREDGPALDGFFRSLPSDDRQFLGDDVTAPDFIVRYLERSTSGNMIPLVAVCGEDIVGNAALYRHLHGWTTHVAQIRMAVAKPFQRKSLGTELARCLVKIAMEHGVDKLVAEVADNQTGAKKAFLKLGFVQEAVLKGHVKDAQGRKRDLYLFANDVSYIWEAMESLVSSYDGAMD